MGPASKDLLPLEKLGPSTSSLESSLFICKNKDPVSRNKPSQLDAKALTAPVPASQVLGRVKDFLSVISEANRRLEVDAKENPENYDIEVLNGNESRIIEMAIFSSDYFSRECCKHLYFILSDFVQDLMLGVADLHNAEAISAAESAIAGYQPADSSSASSSGTDSEDTEDDDDDDDNDGIGDHGGLDSRVPGELRKSNGQGDVSDEIMGKNGWKKQSKRPKIVELP